MFEHEIQRQFAGQFDQSVIARFGDNKDGLNIGLYTGTASIEEKVRVRGAKVEITTHPAACSSRERPQPSLRVAWSSC